MTESHDLRSQADARRPGGVAELIAIAAPMVVSHGCEVAMTFTDRMFLAKIGSHLMSASMAGGLSCYVMMTLFMGLIGYTTALVAQYLGAGRKDRSAAAVTQALIVAVAAYPIILLARPLVTGGMFRLFPVSAAEAGPREVYFNIMIYASVIGLLRHSLCGFFSGIGRTRMVMISTFIAMGVNIALNYVLIFGKLGFGAMGIRGAAYGTIGGGAAGLILLAAAYLRPSIRREYNVLGALRFDREVMGKLLRFGSPAGFEMFMNFAAFVFMVLTFQSHSPVASAAVTIMFNWDMVSFVPLLGVQVGVMSLVGRYMGAGDPDTAARAAISGIKVGWAYSAVILVLFAFFPHQLVERFRPDGNSAVFAEAAPLAVFMIRFASIYVLSEAVMVVFAGALRGAGDTMWTMFASITLHWIQVPIVIVMLHYLHMSPKAGWAAMVVLFMSFSGVFYLRFRGGKWRTIQVIHTPQELLATDHDHDFHEPADL